MKANGALGAVQLYNDPTTSLGVATKQYVDTGISSLTSSMLRRDGTNTITGSLTPSANVTYNLGSSTAWFNDIYGKSFQAKYADVAERFSADAVYETGTVVELGGTNEVTIVKEELSDSVFGVVSSGAAYLLNSTAGTDETHPAIALTGRVPVKVVGKVTKGDRLVSAGNGIARAARMSELTPFNVIGRALENKVSDEQGTIQAIVKINS